ncbi:MAG: hypothetical protein WC523_04295 [Patescibacteria group bacterium]
MNKGMLGVLAIIFALVVSGVLVRKSSDDYKLAQVKQAQWTTTTIIYKKQIKHTGNWYSVPKKAVNVNCYQKQHGREYCFCKDSNYESCQSCPTYDKYCEYDYERQNLVEVLSITGEHDFPYWPNIQIQNSDEMLESSIKFEVFFKLEDKEVVYRAKSLEELEKFVVGNIWKIKINSLGQVFPKSPQNL